MKVTAVSKESPHMPGMSWNSGPYSQLNPFVYLSLVPAEPKKLSSKPKSPERLLEHPTEKVRIKSEGEGEREAEIIRPMVQWNEAMMPSVPVVVTLSAEEFEGIGRPTLGDRLTLTIRFPKRTVRPRRNFEP